jgi:hypothetical protein
MTVFILVIFSTIFACSSSDSTVDAPEECNAPCDKLADCSQGEITKDECLLQCELISNISRPESFTAIIDCLNGPGCDPDSCLVQAADQIADSVLDDFLSAMCTKANQCDQVEIDTCSSQQLAVSEIKELKTYTDANIACLAGCYTDMNCPGSGQVLDDDILKECKQECDLEIDDSQDRGECEDIAGTWTLESISCSGQDQQLGNFSITQTIEAKCGLSVIVTPDGSCSISMPGSYEYDNGSLTWNIDSIDCGGCPDCTDNPAANISIGNISRSFDGNDLILNLNVSPDLTDLGISFCDSGFMIMVYGR